ncbi:MAG: class I SAM-dependent methyltransferase [Paludibacter sp.]|jgi:hypothetical protein|nr:class I SAM-dependent methyltransferase [Paludibacter sp.]MDD4428592.1 class I SAM-dependent methyltransferase [Paludibacter sp.]
MIQDIKGGMADLPCRRFADATTLPFEKEFFDAVVSTDSYNLGET